MKIKRFNICLTDVIFLETVRNPNIFTFSRFQGMYSKLHVKLFQDAEYYLKAKEIQFYWLKCTIYLVSAVERSSEQLIDTQDS